MTAAAFVQATRRLSSTYEPGYWVGAIRPAFAAGQLEHDNVIETYPAHFLVALWEPVQPGNPVLPRWPSMAAIASPDARAALVQLVQHVPVPDRVWLAAEAVDWSLVAEIVLHTDRNLADYHRRELQACVARWRASDIEQMRQAYSDRDPRFEALKERLLPPDLAE
ncbi:hypothetical protein [Caldimonas brevitalea]|uniref:Uncharacterized protein n=1 Tax=Caldimonas brevitalea TaxID=413882 RepID=A0A0G3BKQ9_9BURK|nr:hypothetical protein [Caldimonas brevitalea]AKJ27946.1 hypothetical protein AAW51_1255 [Caldimonas brevitalea]